MERLLTPWPPPALLFVPAVCLEISSFLHPACPLGQAATEQWLTADRNQKNWEPRVASVFVVCLGYFAAMTESWFPIDLTGNGASSEDLLSLSMAS